MPPLRSEVTRGAAAHARGGIELSRRSVAKAARDFSAVRGPRGLADGSLHTSKLRGMTDRVRARLKRLGITYSDQLLEATGRTLGRRRLALRSGIEAGLLERLACRADLARINGIGAI